MNYNILLCILFTTGLFVILRIFGKKGVDNFHGIVINYLVAASCSYISNFNNNVAHLSEVISFLPIAFGIGFMFITVFLLTAKVTQLNGVGIASVASKLSMVIPITVGVFLYKEGMQIQKIIGLVLALIAVFLINLKDPNEKKQKGIYYFLPVFLFIGCGLVDTSIKYSQHYYISDNNRQLFIMSMFGCAGIIGLSKLTYDLIIHKKTVALKSIAGGLVLGTVNYFSLIYLIRAFEFPAAESSKIFAQVNVGVVILSSVIAIILFNEHLNKFKIAGIFISIVAILTLYFV